MIISQRYIDKFKPGDEIPAGVYSDAQIAKWISLNKVTSFETPAPAKPKRTRKKAAVKK